MLRNLLVKETTGKKKEKQPAQMKRPGGSGVYCPKGVKRAFMTMDGGANRDS